VSVVKISKTDANVQAATIEPQGHVPGPGNLTSRTLSGLKWTYLATLVSGILQVGVTAAMARLVTPADYGLIAAAGLFVSFGGYFSDMGVGQALIQKLTLDEEDIRAAFTSTTGIGLLAASVMCAFAPLSRVFLNSLQMATVTRLLALTLALNGLASTSLNLLRRNLRFDAVSKVEVASYAFSYGLLGIPMAIAHCGVWALIAVSLLQPLLRLTFAYAYQRHTIRPCLRWKSHRALLSYGSKMSLAGFAEYIFVIADSTIVGRLWGSVLLGIYNRANMLANLPGYNLSIALMKVLFPAFSRAQEDPRRLTSAYLQGLAGMMLVAMPVAMGMIPAARDLVLVVLGKQYTSAAPLLQVMVFALPMGMMAAVAATVTNARGEVTSRMVQQVLMCPLIWVAVFVAARWGIIAVAVSSVSVQAVRLIVFQRLAQKSLGLGLREVGKATRPSISLALLVAAVVAAVAWGLDGAVPVARLVAEITAAALVWLGYCVWFLPAEVTPVVLRAMDASRIVERFPSLGWYRARIS
jgi:lipopolysaccharide exporter